MRLRKFPADEENCLYLTLYFIERINKSTEKGIIMKTIIGKYNSADVYTDLIEESAEAQIQQLCDQPFTKDCRIAIMPDVHAGAGCVIGFTANLGDLVIPNLIGVDIGCGMLVVCLGKTEMDNRELDNIIHNHVPAGMNTHDVATVSYPALRDFHCYNDLKNVSRIECSLGTLGGGNHFIEVDRSKNGDLWLVIHTGSRHLGLEVANYYQNLAWKDMSEPRGDEISDLISRYKAEGRLKEIADALAALKAKRKDCGSKDLAYLTGQHMADYLNDMGVVQRFAEKNRQTIAEIILKGLGIVGVDRFTTIHNYIDLDDMILRKGAVSAKDG